jgi:outer membrane protein TolC
MKRLLFLIVIFLLSGVNGFLFGQQIPEFSLEGAVQYALKNNYGIRNSQTDVSIAQREVRKMTALGLPQISADVTYTNFLQLPTSLIPGEFLGQEPGTLVQIQFGTPYNADANISLSQLIFNGSYLIGLKASRTFVEMSRILLQRSQIQLREDISTAYFNVIILEESKKIADSTLTSLKKTYFEVQETFKSGFVENTDVDQIELLVQDLETGLLNLNKQLEIAYNYLKFQMGMKISQPIILTDNLDKFIQNMNQEVLLNSSFDYNQHIDYRIIQTQQVLKTMNMKVKKADYMPSLVGYVSLSESAQRTSWNFLELKQPWFQTSQFGITLSIPILSSGIRSSALQQAKLEVEKVKVLDDQVKEGLLLEYTTDRSNYQNAIQVYNNKKRSADIALKIYNKTLLKYREGLATSMDIQQSYNQYLTALTNYIASTRDLLVAKTKLEKVLTKN